MTTEHKKKRNDFILIALALCFALLYLLGSRLLTGKHASKAEISVDGQIVATVLLSEEQEDLLIPSGTDGSNHLSVHNNTIQVTEASCPDKVCVNQGAVSQSGQTIVCLPNKMVVTIK